MSFIKKNQKLLILLFIVVLLLGSWLYYQNVLTIQLQTLKTLNYENEINQLDLDRLNAEYLALGQRKKELKDIDMQTKSLEEKLPTYETSTILLSEVIAYTKIYNFPKRAVKGEPVLPKVDEAQEYRTLPITIEYTSTYEESVKFLEMINRSYQMMTIESYSIDNSIQEKTDDEDAIPVSKDTVETVLVLHMHFRDKGEAEVYPNFMEYLEKEENIFQRPLKDPQPGLDKPATSDTPEAEQPAAASASASSSKMAKTTAFNIHLADILRSGDNYSFSGYSPGKDPVYVGLTSSKDTKMVLTINETGYSCLIEDSEGNKSEKKIDTVIDHPSINITSQIQNVMEVMPTASIYVRNYTPKVININLRGTSLENVVIYNENNQIVKPGTQAGKIAVAR